MQNFVKWTNQYITLSNNQIEYITLSNNVIIIQSIKMCNYFARS